MSSPERPQLCIVAGLPRAGSTFLYHNLGLHPQIFPPFRKETNFFLSNYNRGLDWYLSLFAERTAAHRYCLDVSPSYFVEHQTIERIQQYGGKSKIIIVVRDLDDLAVSWYEQQLTHFNDFISFEQFLTDWTAQRGDEKVHINMGNAPFKRSILAYKKAFGEDLLLIKFDEIRHNSLSVLNAIEDFLGVESFYQADNYTDGAINARNRANFRPLTWLLSREWLITLINKLFPRQLILKLRSMLDTKSMPERSVSEASVADAPDPRKALAKQVIAEDIAYFDELFSQGNIQLGDGTVLSPSSKS